MRVIEMRTLFLVIVSLLGFSAYGQQPKAITNSIGMKLVLIHAGAFTMGSPDEEIRRQENEAPHEITISKSYYLGVFEVTQEQYERVMGKNPSHFKDEKKPVEMVSWDDASSFCKRLSELSLEISKGRLYRLPTEAEWEYACRATSTTAFCFGDSAESLGEYAWFGEGQIGKPHQVGEKNANRWGLYDMHGNVWWCQDEYSPFPSSVVTDTFRSLRGGCLAHDAEKCRSARRYGTPGIFRYKGIGFRVALSLPTKASETEASPSK